MAAGSSRRPLQAIGRPAPAPDARTHGSTRWRRATVLLAACALALLVGPAPATARSQPSGDARAASWLLAIQAPRGTLLAAPVSGGRGRPELLLTLRDVEGAIAFTQRPLREAVLLRPATVVRQWRAWFGDNAPNALLSYADRQGRGSSASAVLVLSKPTWDPASRTMSFRARQTVAVGTSAPALPPRMSHASLVVDTFALQVNLRSCPGAYTDAYFEGWGSGGSAC